MEEIFHLVVLGSRVQHSLSPAIHSAALEACGLRGDFIARRVDEDGMSDAASQLRSGGLSGASITMPHKHLAARLCDHLDALARRAGAANTWVGVGGRVEGFNTDVAGVEAAWRWAGLPEGPVLILGGGGAAAAALLALEGRDLAISTRRPSDLPFRLGVDVRQQPWGEPLAGVVVVNATPLGMKGENLPAAVLDAATGLLDMAYGAEPTAAERVMRQTGRPCAAGLDMLVGQAAAAFELWTGVGAPVEAMRSAAQKAQASS